MPKWDDWKKSLGDSRPWHILDPGKHVEDPNLPAERLSVCLSCEFYRGKTICDKCGCLMSVKVHLALAECPIGKWGKEDLQ
jgi:hypothetical protein